MSECNEKHVSLKSSYFDDTNQSTVHSLPGEQYTLMYRVLQHKNRGCLFLKQKVISTIERIRHMEYLL